jgi:hypothetical protein
MIEVKGNQLRMEGSEDEVESQVAAVLAGYTRFLYKNYPPCVAKENQLLHELFSFNEEDK